MVDMLSVYEGQLEHLKNQLAIVEFDLNFNVCADKEFYKYLQPKFKSGIKRIKKLIKEIKNEKN